MAKQHVWKQVQLPSRGYYYEGAVPDGNVLIRKFTVEEEQVLQSQGISGLDRMARIVRQCSAHVVEGEKLNHNELLLTDRMAILIYQRILTFGPNYTFGFRCPACGAQSKAKVNLVKDFDEITPDDLKVRLAEKYPEQYESVEDVDLSEPFEVTLEDVGEGTEDHRPITVKLRLLRGKDELEVFKRSKRQRMRSLDDADPSYSIRIAQQIVEKEGVAPDSLNVTEMFVRSLTATDSSRIRITTDEREPGLDTAVATHCGSCGYEAQTALQFDLEFFRPTSL